MSMTRRDYVLLSETIADYHRRLTEDRDDARRGSMHDDAAYFNAQLDAVEELTELLGDALSGANHRFEYDRFVEDSLTSQSV